MKCLRRLLPELNLEDEKLAPEVLNKLSRHYELILKTL